MTTPNNTDTSTDQSTSRSTGFRITPAVVIAAILGVALVGAMPVHAQDGSPGGEGANAICDNQTLSNLLSGAFTLLTAAGIIGALVMYKWQAVVGIISSNPTQQGQMAERKQQIKSSAITIILIDVAWVVVAQLTGLPTFGCVF